MQIKKVKKYFCVLDYDTQNDKIERYIRLHKKLYGKASPRIAIPEVMKPFYKTDDNYSFFAVAERLEQSYIKFTDIILGFDFLRGIEVPISSEY